MAITTCPTCGRALDEHDRDIRFVLPDPVLDLPDREATDGLWMSHGTANESVLMQVPDLGGFVRALLPVRLTGGYFVTFGVWVGVHPDDLQRAFKVWWAPEYAGLRLEGRLANSVAPWGLLGVPVQVGVRDPDESPWITGSSDAEVTSLLTTEWSHELVLDTLSK